MSITKLRFKFFIQPYVKPQMANYAHCALSIAEGFKELGVTYYGNIDYWNPNGEGYTIKQAPEGYEFDVAIYADDFLMQHRHDMEEHLSPVFNVLTDSSGFPWMREWTPTKTATDLQAVLNRPEFGLFDLVLRSHCTGWFHYPSNSAPWAFGLTNRLIELADRYRNQELLPQVAMNFRILHDARKEFVTRLNPLIGDRLPVINQITEGLETQQKAVKDTQEQYYWDHTGRRHSNDYYKFIGQSQFTYSFGGLVDFPYPGKPLLQQFHRYSRFLKTRLGLPNSAASDLIIYQHDSWRFWEVMASNSIPVHMDYNDWQLVLPVYPENGKHYIGVKRFDLQATADIMLNSSASQLEAIARDGRAWVMEHYAPVPVAKRFVTLLGERM